MTLTPEKLKNLLVAYYVASWRSNGVPVTLQEMIGQTFRFDPDSDDDLDSVGQLGPYETYLSMKHSNGYLRVRCDDSAPNDPSLKSHYKDLEVFMANHPDVVAAMDLWLDKDIERHGLVQMFDSKPLGDMNRKEKVSQQLVNFLNSFWV